MYEYLDVKMRFDPFVEFTNVTSTKPSHTALDVFASTYCNWDYLIVFCENKVFMD